VDVQNSKFLLYFCDKIVRFGSFEVGGRQALDGSARKQELSIGITPLALSRLQAAFDAAYRHMLYSQGGRTL